MANSDPMLAADRMNARVEYGAKYYKDTLTKKLKAAVEQGIIGLVPFGSKAEEYQSLLARYAELEAIVLNPTAMPGLRERAQRDLQRFFQLDQEFYGPRSPV